MNQFSRLALVPLLLVLLTACGTTSTDGGSGFRDSEATGNSSGIVENEPLGSGDASIGALRKIADHTLVTDHPDLRLGTAYLTRFSDATEAIYLTLPVTNESAQTLCWIMADGISYRDGATELIADSFALLKGSVGRIGSGNLSNDCLGPGETGYLTGIEVPLDGDPAYWSLVDNIQIGSLYANPGTLDQAGKLVPVDYEVDGTGVLTTVTGQNQGSTTLYPGRYSVYFLLDGAGAPLGWSYLDEPASDGLTPGSSLVWTEGRLYEGTAAKLRVHFDYGDSPTTAAVQAQGTGFARDSELLRLRERRAALLQRDELARRSD
ncbi:MAG TPA: hypothetical protein VF168_12240 [Trueperaceae bacterium]